MSATATLNATEYQALRISYDRFETQGEHNEAVAALVKNTHHLTRGEYGASASVGNNSDNCIISIDGPAAIVAEYLEQLMQLPFNVVSIRPQRSVMALAA
jgi:hypothetical protein